VNTAMKLKILYTALVALCLSILASGTIAYFTAEDTAHNVITTSGVDIQIVEYQADENGDWQPYPEDEVIEIMPSRVVSKIVTVENLEAESYIRVRYDVQIVDKNGVPMEHTPQELAELVRIHPDTEHWQQKEGESDWWYYKQSVPTGESTKPLFTEVEFDGPNMTNEYQQSTLSVIIYAQSVQKANNGETVLEAAGWP